MRFTIHHDPIPKGRPRVTRRGITYTPQRTKDAEREIAQQVRESKECPETPTEDPVMVELLLYVPMPVSWSKRKKFDLLGEPCVDRSDCDNRIKLINDALNGILWKDDNQIWSITARQYWGVEGKIIVTVN